MIDAAMTDGAALTGAIIYGLRAAGLWRDERQANLLDGGDPIYGCYTCADGTRGCGRRDRAAIPRRAVRRARRGAGSRPHGDCRGLRHAARATNGWRISPARTPASLRCWASAKRPDHPHNRARETFIELDGVIQPRPAPRLDGTPPPPPRAPRDRGRRRRRHPCRTWPAEAGNRRPSGAKGAAVNPQFEAMPISIFEEMSLAAARHGAVNLGQGFPDFGWPEPLLDEAARLLREGSNQYPPSRGLPVLREALAAFYAERQGLALAPDQFVVTSGATEAIAAVLLAVLEPGDGAIVIAPAYDAYAPLIRRAGGRGAGSRPAPAVVAHRPRPARRRGNASDPAAGRQQSAQSDRAGARCRGRIAGDRGASPAHHDLLILSDEVWEEVLAPGARFTSLAALAPERTIKVGSAGKIFSLTGWKVGWAAAPAELADVIARAHQYLTFATPPHLQAAVAAGLGRPDWLDRAARRVRQAPGQRLAAGPRTGRLRPAAERGHVFPVRRSQGLGHRPRRPRLCGARGGAGRGRGHSACPPSPKASRSAASSACASPSATRRSMPELPR